MKLVDPLRILNGSLHLLIRTETTQWEMMSTIRRCFINYYLQLFKYDTYLLRETEKVLITATCKKTRCKRRNCDLHTWTSCSDRVNPLQWMWCTLGSLSIPTSFCSEESNISTTQLLFPIKDWLLFLNGPSNWRKLQLLQLFFLCTLVLASANALPQSEDHFLSTFASAVKLLPVVSVIHRPSTENTDLAWRIAGMLPCMSLMIP